MEIPNLLDLIRSHISEDTLIRRAAEFRRYPIRLSFSSYNQGIDWIVAGYGKAGLETEVVEFPADGKTTFADRHFPLAWDIEEGWLEIPGEYFSEKRICDYQTDPYGIVPFCADSQGIQEANIVPVSVLREKGFPQSKGKIMVLFEAFPDCADLEWAMDSGCAACLAHAGAKASDPVKYTSRRWFNEIFGMGQIDARHRTFPAFSISSKQADEMKKAFETRGPLPARYCIRSRTYEGKVKTGHARILGAEQPDREFFLSAHAYEPHASNDVSGVIICMEAGRVLAQLIREGKLSRPKRTIHFLHGFETFSVYYYALANRDLMRRSMGGLSFDGLGHGDRMGLQERLDLFRTYDFNPSYLNGVLKQVLSYSAEKMGVRADLVHGFTSNDNVIQDPFFGPAWGLLQGKIMTDSGVYHTNADTTDLLSAPRLAEYAAFGAASAYCMADAGAKEALEFSQIVQDDCTDRVTAAVKETMAFAGKEREQVRLRSKRFHLYIGTVIPSGMQAIESVMRLANENEQEKIQLQVASLARSFRKFAEGEAKLLDKNLARACGFDLPPLPMTPVEKEAASLIPSRNLGGTLGLGIVTDAARQEAVGVAEKKPCKEFWTFFAPGFFWIDGKRSILDIAQAEWVFSRWIDREKTGSDTKKVEQTLKMIRFLEKYGYVQISHRPKEPPA